MARELVDYEAVKEKMTVFGKQLHDHINSLKMQLSNMEASSTPDEKTIYEINHKLKRLDDLQQKLNDTSMRITNDFNFYKITNKKNTASGMKKFTAFLKHPIKVTSLLSKVSTYKKEKKAEFKGNIKKTNDKLSLFSTELDTILNERAPLREEKKLPPVSKVAESPPPVTTGGISRADTKSSDSKVESKTGQDVKSPDSKEERKVEPKPEDVKFSDSKEERKVGPKSEDTKSSDSKLHAESGHEDLRLSAESGKGPVEDELQSFTVSWPEKKEKKLPVKGEEQSQPVRWHFKGSTSTSSIDSALHSASTPAGSVKERLALMKKEQEAAKTLEVFLTQLKQTLAYEKQKVDHNKLPMDDLTKTRLEEDKLILQSLQKQVSNPELLDESRKLEKTIDALLQGSPENKMDEKIKVTFHRRKKASSDPTPEHKKPKMR